MTCKEFGRSATLKDILKFCTENNIPIDDVEIEAEINYSDEPSYYGRDGYPGISLVWTKEKT
jgi:hypothetical protein